ncbi:hypothetical protein PINS_up003008 [Pythium insidiosum]|nr:hypothetical protein PINS_up003008 [Pythium insidiosum]
MSDGDAMLCALDEWNRHFHQSKPDWGHADESPKSSCAELRVLVGHHGDNLDRYVRDLAELLDLVEISTRGPMDPLLFHRLVDRDAKGCPLSPRWCSFCDGVDRRVVLTLTPKRPTFKQTRQPFLAVVRRALYERDDATEASPAFPQLQSQLLTRLTTTPTTQLQRLRPIELKIDVDKNVVLEDLELLLKAMAEAEMNDSTFLVTLLQLMNVGHEAMALIAASQVPVAIRDPSDWSSAVQDRDSESTTSVLPIPYVRKLDANFTWDTDKLLETLRHRCSQLQELQLEFYQMPPYGLTNEEDAWRAARMLRLSQTLFGCDSLRLSTLDLIADLCERDLQHMVQPMSPPLGSSSQGTVRHQFFSLRTSALSTFQGATLGRLLTQSGGVKSLVLDGGSALSFTQVVHLVQSCPSLQSLKVKASCPDEKTIPSSSLSSSESNSPDNVSIKQLELQLVDRKSSMIANAVPRFLGVLGGSLESLSILPRRSSAILKADVAAAIVHHCPRIEQLRVRNADDSFVARLFESLCERPSKLKKLSLVAGDANVEYRALLAALSTATHPVSRVLRSLEIDVCGWDDEDVLALAIRLREMLKTNGKLHNVTLVAYETWPRDDEATARGGGWASTMPPFRHRLAALSVLRRLSLPTAVLADILTMAGRPVHRFWLERKKDPR